MKGARDLRRRQAMAAAWAALAGLAAAAGAAGAAGPGDAPPPTPAPWRELVVAQGRLAGGPGVIAATKGERLRWRVRSDAPGELHLHAYRVSVAVQRDQAAEVEFTAHATGRFRLEWHAAAAAGAADGARHHAPPLAVLEVRPP